METRTEDYDVVVVGGKARGHSRCHYRRLAESSSF